MFYKEDKVNLLIGLLKEYGVKKVVLCPGSRNAIIVNNILDDKRKQINSVIDKWCENEINMQ